ncbi:MAG: protein kinase [Deltaproteobacteria bacterium]|nr:protein kinase [Deltaproteobacteria bacterium]
MIQVGQVLDKYELLERVGQGGMAIVYRGLDRSLKRTVAIKVLHKHLADYQEARDRFEREAQAVAKLRHENILEIFDYAAKEDSEAYIVTEFIDGQTLKQFVTERPIAFPEIGAMIMLQVCRALAHAHAGGILHRDVKPENIMIRSDGVVKLMDFGISHMVDLERLTVTGQLLGSPAYMAPEHVEGRPLDFRTDVFAAGIVLYQLTVGKLPFEGKNPHEVLKRIAECKFVDPRQANPRIGNRLGRIMLRAMAASPNDRYPAIGEMVLAIEAYLEESGLPSDKVSGELARYFQAPASYEQALRDRLVDHLTRRGQKLLADGDQAPALDVFDRVLTIDPKNEKVIGILDGINRRARMKQAALALLGIAVLAGGGYMVHRKNLPPEAQSPVANPVVSPPHVENPTTNVSHEQAPPDAAPVVVAQDAAQTQVVVTSPRDAATVGPQADAMAIGTPTHVTVSPAKNVVYRVGPEGAWKPVPEDGSIEVPLTEPTKIYVHDTTNCCQDDDHVVEPGKEWGFEINALSAQIIPRCPGHEKAYVNVDGRIAHVDEKFGITFGNSVVRTKKIKVEFVDAALDKTPIEVTVEPAKEVDATCVVH